METIRVGLDRNDIVAPLEEAHLIMETTWDGDRLVKETIYVHKEASDGDKAESA